MLIWLTVPLPVGKGSREPRRSELQSNSRIKDKTDSLDYMLPFDTVGHEKYKNAMRGL